MGREGTNEGLSARFAGVRIHVGASNESGKSAQKWLLIEWPKDENEPAKYWLSTLPRNISFRDLVDATKLRWRIERDRQELKQEIGSGMLKGGVGAAFIITPGCASLPTDSWSPKGRPLPPQDLIAWGCSRNLPCPTVTDPEDPPLWSERHVPNSIATMRHRLMDAIARLLPRCPCCHAPTSRYSGQNR
jgi:hypothetical protein